MVSDQPGYNPSVLIDSEAKSQIKRLVLELREEFEKDFSLQLRRLGIRFGEEPKDPPSYLDETEKTQRSRILALIRREEEAEGSRDKAVSAYVRDCTFTIINRLIGLRCMEARELLIIDGETAEVVTTHGPTVHGGNPSLIAKMREEDSDYRNPTDGHERLWRDALKRAYEAISEDIGVLFDPEHEFSILFPTHSKLTEAIREINRQLPSEAYQAPDFLGWVYQFFNAEEKEEIRKATRGKPRNSRELAVLNQFYTPDWIVKFLVDNTLGRIWVQLRPDTRLYWKNRVGDRDPDSMTAEEKQQIMFQGVNVDYLVPDTGEADPVPARSVSEITLLDPACGTMHFGQYAYALYYQMYLEEGVVPPEDIPVAILENNLFGIDIDPRAIQIAALTLLLTMKEQARVHGEDPAMLTVQHMNLICANSVNLGDEERDKLLQRLDPTIFGGPVPMRRAVEALWQNLEYVGELGSLVQVDDSVDEALSQVATWRMKFVDEKQATLGEDPEWGSLQARLSAEERMSAREYLTQELQSLIAKDANGDPMAKLFAQETEKGLDLLDVLGRQHDAVVMNPPFGAAAAKVSSRLDASYPEWSRNLAIAFTMRAIELCAAWGVVGTVSDASLYYRSSYEEFRSKCVLSPKRLVSYLDAGWETLDDANVEVAALVLKADGKVDTPLFVDLSRADNEADLLSAVLAGDREDCAYRESTAAVERSPWSAFAYRMPPSILRAYLAHPKLSDELAVCPSGGLDAPAAQYYRRAWECGDEPRANGAFAPFWNGSRFFSPYHATCVDAIRWNSDGKVISEEPKANVRWEDWYFKPCLAWGKRSQVLNVSMIDDRVFSKEGQAIFPLDEGDTHWLLAYLNSSLLRGVLNMYCGQHKYGSHVGQLPIAPPRSHAARLDSWAGRAHRIGLLWDSGNEIAPNFEVPWVLQVLRQHPEVPECEAPFTLRSILDHCEEWELKWASERQHLQGEIDETVYHIYQVPPEERETIERELGERPSETVWPQMVGRSAKEKRLEHVLRLLSYTVKTICDEDEDGIVPLVACAEEASLVERVRAKLGSLFGSDQGHQVETDINNELRAQINGNRNCGKNMELETWLSSRFFAYHTRLYERRPIYWHIASADGSFGALVHYHRFNRNRLQKLRAHYLGSFRDRIKRAIGELQGEDSKEAQARLKELEENLRAADELDNKLGQILTGDYPIEVPWKGDDEQPDGWEPDIDDGVKVNIQPFQEAGVLAVNDVV